MSTVVLLTPYLTDRDAIGNDILQTRRLLTELGHRVEICADLVHLNGLRILSLKQGRKLLAHPDTILIYHHSVGWERGLNAIFNARCRRIVRYHNITPAEYFHCYNPDLAAACSSGREHLARLARSDVDLFVSDSEYNQDELLALGVDARRARVVPPFHVIQQLLDASNDAAVAQQLSNSKVNLITVGRIVPNKGHGHLLKAFAVYHHLYNRDSRLWVIGKEEPGQKDYARAIRRMTAALQLNHSVVFTGGVSEAALKTFYQSADAFVITSEHEGFCVPVVEAMAFETPVIAYGTTALPHTIGEAGIVWDRFDAVLFAETVQALTADGEAADALRRRGRVRFDRHFSDARIAERFFQCLKGVLSVPDDAAVVRTEQLRSDGFDAESFKQRIESDAERRRPRLAAKCTLPRIGDDASPIPHGKLLDLISGGDAFQAEQSLEQIERNLTAAWDNRQFLGDVPVINRQRFPLRWILQRLVPLIARLNRLLARNQTIYNNNTNLALQQLIALQQRSNAQIKELELRLARFEAAAGPGERRLAG